MHVLITGAAGMIGRKLTERLVTDRGLCGHPVEKLTLVDVVAPPTSPSPASPKRRSRSGRT
jgi:nucleoside-diphosphate-sugar epimerase